MTVSKKHINFALAEEQLDEPSNPIDTIVRNIKNYSQENGKLLQKYNEQFYLTYFDRTAIQQTLIKLGNHEQQKKQMKLQEFMRKFLSFIEHKQDQTLFLAMSLRNLFLKIKEQANNQTGVKFSDFTNFLCERIAKQDPDLVVPLKQVPQEKITPDVQRIRQIDINPPIVMKNSQADQPRIAKQKKKKDKKLVQRKPVSQFIFNSQTNQIITMGRLSSCIHFYDMQLKKMSIQIIPKTYKDMQRQIAILSMDFDQSHQRIGAIINGIGIAFWQASDNFETQKTISKYQDEKIWYLNLFQEWITADKNTVYFWDIKQEAVSRKIYHEEAVMINDVCEINHLRCICVSYTMMNDKKPFIVYKDGKQIVKYEMGSSGCHSLHYNIPSQMIITAGYHNQLQVFEVQNKTYSVNLKKQLKGHSSIVTCVTDIKNTNFILSGDDSGQVRIWELNFMKCLQVVKISKYINELYCTGDKLIFADSRLNTMEMDKFQISYSEDEEIIHHFFEEESQKQFVITRKSIRRINFNNGRIEFIFFVCDEQEEISSALRISSGILIGTSKGVMKLFSLQGAKKWQVLAHQSEISQLRYDRKTRFIFSLGTDNKLMIWPQKSILIDGAKKMITFKNKNFNLLALLNQVRLMFLGSTQECQITVWDYETLKLLTVIKLNSPILFMQVNQIYKILMISTVYDEFCFIKLIWKAGFLSYEMVYNGDSGFSGLKKDKKLNYSVSIKEADYEDANIRKTKQKTFHDIVSKKNLMKQSRMGDIFLTSTKLEKETQTEQRTLKKSGVKISVKNLEYNGNEDQTSKMPSIKLILQDTKESVIDDMQQTLGTLKTLKKIDNQITTRMQIKQTQQSTLLIIGNSKGQIVSYNINNLIKQHFQQYDLPLKKNQSPHMYRPAKQDYDQQISKQKHSTLTLETIDKIPKVKKCYFSLVWKETCPNKEPITCISFIEMKKVYVCISMTDGYYKVFDLDSGVLKGNVRISLPLPMVWDLSMEKDLYIRRNVYETLIVLDSILTNHGFEMLSKEYKSINVTKFLQLLKKHRTLKKKISSKIQNQKPLSRQNKKITLLHEQFSIEDLKKSGLETNRNQNTLKSLQAYKRVKQIKEQMMRQVKQRGSLQDLTNKDGIQKVSGQLLRQKEQIQKLFTPNYFSVIGEFSAGMRLNKSVQIGSLDERSIVLLEKINDNKKKLYSEYVIGKPCETKLRRQASHLPTLPTIKSQLINTVPDDSNGNKENTLVAKLTNSLSEIGQKQKPTELVSIYSNAPMISSLLKNSSSASMNSSKLSSNNSKLQKMNTFDSKLSEVKREQLMTKRSMLEDQSTKQILSQINEKLQRYKKVSYSKRDFM